MTFSSSSGPLVPITVLLVDDQEIIGTAIARMLASERDINLQFCSDGSKALELAIEVKPQIILQDLVMPGTSGLELVEQYRDHPLTEDIPIIVLSSKEDPDTKTEAFARGADDYLVKIPDKFELVGRIRHHVAQLLVPAAQVAPGTLPPTFEFGTPKGSFSTPSAVAAQLETLVPDSTSGGDLSLQKLEVNIIPRLPIQDLAKERLLADAGRRLFQGQPVPVLRGIALLSKIGQGGMGAVFYGIHTRLQCEVAVKILPPHLAESKPQLVNRFYREAQIAARIQSPNLVNVLDVDQEDSLFYLVMEFVAGITAKEFGRSNKLPGKNGVSEAAALRICLAASAGLAAAHNGGVIHRDIKPENILIPRADESGELKLDRAKLADLGIAVADEDDSGLTQENVTMGTPGYMAPEQVVDAKSVGKPADVFGMGATLYLLLAGTKPVSGKTVLEIAMATVNDPYDPIASHRNDISGATLAIIDRTLTKAPEDRLRDGDALVQVLEAALESLEGSKQEQAKARKMIKAL